MKQILKITIIYLGSLITFLLVPWCLVENILWKEIISILASVLSGTLVLFYIHRKFDVLHSANFLNQKIDRYIIVLVILIAFGLVITVPTVKRIIFGSILGITTTSHHTVSDSLTVVYFITVMHAIFIGPIIEELVFRKSCINIACKNNSLFFSIIVSSLAFGLFHGLWDIPTGLTHTLSGIMYAIIYTRTNNIIYSIIMHAAHNAIVTLIDLVYTLNLFSLKNTICTIEGGYIIWNSWLVLIGTLILVVSFIILILRTKNISV